MNYPLYQNSGTASHNRLLLAGMLVLLACAFRTVAPLPMEKLTAPATAAVIIPPPGNSVFPMGPAVGTQGYVCLPTSTAASWAINGSRPEATLFSSTVGHDVQIISHFLSPDSSPNEFAPQPAPFGSATWQSSVDRSKVRAQFTQAGSAPATGCSAATDVGKQALVPYTADYYFFRADE